MSLAAHYELIAQLNEARLDLPLFLQIRVQNSGSSAWPALNLSYHWLHTDQTIAEYDGIRTPLPQPLAAGEQCELELQLEPPLAAGAYLLAIDLVEEGVGWFSQRGVAPLLIPITVQPEAPYRRKIAIVAPVCWPNDAVGNSIVRQMHYFAERGDRVMVLLEYVTPLQPLALRQHMAVLSVDAIKKRGYNTLMRRALSHFLDADLLIFHFATPYDLFEAITLTQRGISILDYHSVTPRQLWSGDETSRQKLQQLDAQLDLLGYADYAIAHSAYTRDELIARQKLLPERIVQIGFEAPLERFNPGPRDPDLLQRYGLNDTQPLLLYVGRLANNKRLDDLVRAVTLLQPEYPDLKLLIVGDTRPPYAEVAEQIIALASELGVRENVLLTGQVSDAELPAHYRLADIFVTASLHEGFGIPVIEAMASGVPVVGTNVTALPETIGDGGLTFAPQNIADLARQIGRLLASRKGL